MAKKINALYEAKARKMLSEWILRQIMTDRYVMGRMTREEYHEKLKKFIAYEVSLTTGVTKHRCEQLHNEIMAMWLNDETYQQHAARVVESHKADTPSNDRVAMAIMNGEAQPVIKEDGSRVHFTGRRISPMEVFARADQEEE